MPNEQDKPQKMCACFEKKNPFPMPEIKPRFPTCPVCRPVILPTMLLQLPLMPNLGNYEVFATNMKTQSHNPKNYCMLNFAIHEHNTRSKYGLHTQFCNTYLFQKSVINTGVKLYKYLPSKIKKLENFKCFRKEMKLVLLKNSFYMLEEFYQSKSEQ
jgi:hypothetical protein